MKRQIVFCLMMGILLMPGFLSVSLQAQEITDAQPPITQRKIDVYNVKELVANQYNDPQVWMDHLENDLMKFWGNKANTVGKSDFSLLSELMTVQWCQEKQLTGLRNIKMPFMMRKQMVW